MSVAGFLEQWDVPTDDGFRRRVEVAICAAAIAIQSENPATGNHANRAAYAKLVLNAPDSYTPLFARAIAANDSTLTPASADAQIRTAVDSVWNALAGTL